MLAAPQTARLESEAQRASASGRRIRLTHIDGNLPNLALMKLAAYHRSQGDEIVFTQNVERDFFEGEYDIVYGSTLFEFSRPLVERLRAAFPGAIVGGTGLHNDPTTDWKHTVEAQLNIGAEQYDYSIYDHGLREWKSRPFTASVGRISAGCRMRCNFCRVPEKEGRPLTVNSPFAIWRGEPYPRHLVLLDNDPFGVPRAEWEKSFEQIRKGDFRVSFVQGINIRLINDEAARALASIKNYDHENFKERRIYTAWDSLKDEVIFFRGIERLLNAGVAARTIQVYMLIGYAPDETWDRIEYRHQRMVDMGLRPYPMPYQAKPGVSGNDLAFRDLKRFQRWAIRSAKFGVPFSEYDPNARKHGWKPGQNVSPEPLFDLKRSA